jgi:hypothetical protein
MLQPRHKNGSAGDVDYGEIGSSYVRFRQPDPIIAAQIHEALGPARTVLNVGAGTGSYEPTDREITAVEPSASMRAQRTPNLSAAIDAVAEDLPFKDTSFDAPVTTILRSAVRLSRNKGNRNHRCIYHTPSYLCATLPSAK